MTRVGSYVRMMEWSTTKVAGIVSSTSLLLQGQHRDVMAASFVSFWKSTIASHGEELIEAQPVEKKASLKVSK